MGATERYQSHFMASDKFATLLKHAGGAIYDKTALLKRRACEVTDAIFEAPPQGVTGAILNKGENTWQLLCLKTLPCRMIARCGKLCAKLAIACSLSRWKPHLWQGKPREKDKPASAFMLGLPRFILPREAPVSCQNFVAS